MAATVSSPTETEPAKRRRYTPYTVRYTRYLWLYELTPAGRFLFWSVVFTAASLATVVIPVYQIFSVLLSSYVVVWFVSLAYRPTLETTGSLPRCITAGEELRADFEITNRSWRPAYDIMLWIVALPKSIRMESADVAVARLGPGETTTLPLVLRPQRRGVYELPELRPHSTFPFNLMRSGSARVPLGPLIVLPNFHPIGGMEIPVGLKYQPGGVALSSNIGESPEYIGNRDYVPGLPTRRLDFRGWARLARPVVREYQEEYYCRVALILDTWQPGRISEKTGSPQLEAAISLAASIADSLAATEYLLDVFAAGSELYVFRAGRSISSFDNVLEILAAVDACRSNPFTTIGPAIVDELSSISTTICVFLDWDESRAELVRTIHEAGCESKILIVRDQKLSQPLPADAGDVVRLTVGEIEQGGLQQL